MSTFPLSTHTVFQRQWEERIKAWFAVAAAEPAIRRSSPGGARGRAGDGEPRRARGAAGGAAGTTDRGVAPRALCGAGTRRAY